MLEIATLYLQREAGLTATLATWLDGNLPWSGDRQIMTLWGTAIAAAILTVLFLLERFFPLRQPTRPLIARLITNVAITSLAVVVNATAVQFAVQMTQQWTYVISP